MLALKFIRPIFGIRELILRLTSIQTQIVPIALHISDKFIYATNCDFCYRRWHMNTPIIISPNASLLVQLLI